MDVFVSTSSFRCAFSSLMHADFGQPITGVIFFEMFPSEVKSAGAVVAEAADVPSVLLSAVRI